MCRGSAARAVWSRSFGAAQTMHLHDHVKFLQGGGGGRAINRQAAIFDDASPR